MARLATRPSGTSSAPPSDTNSCTTNELPPQPIEATFRELALKNLPPKPRHYPRLQELITPPPATAAGSIVILALPPADFKKAAANKANVLVDTRHMLAFGGGHLPGALNIGAAGPRSFHAGWMLEPERPPLLVVESDAQVRTVVHHFAHTGLNRFAGYLAGGMSAWENAGHDLESLPRLHVKELAARVEDANEVSVVDVRSPQEWAKGHVRGARHIVLPELPVPASNLGQTEANRCVLRQRLPRFHSGQLVAVAWFEVSNLPGSLRAYKASGLPMEAPDVAGTGS